MIFLMLLFYLFGAAFTSVIFSDLGIGVEAYQCIEDDKILMYMFSVIWPISLSVWIMHSLSKRLYNYLKGEIK